MFEGIANRDEQRQSEWLIGSVLGFLLIAASLMLACDGKIQSTASAPAPATSPVPTNVHLPTPITTTARGLTVQAPLNDGPVAGVGVHDRSNTVPPVGSTWVLRSLDGRPVIEGSFVALKVFENSIGGYGGCNRIGGPATVGGRPAGPKPFFGPDGLLNQVGWGKTERGCLGPEGWEEQEDDYARVLPAVETYRLEKDRLELFDGDGVLRLVFFRQEPLPGHQTDLEGTAWRQMGDETVTLVFLEGLVNGETACRDLVATYRLFPRLRFPSMGMRGSGESCSEQEWASESITDFLSYAWGYSVYEEAGEARLAMRSAEGDTRIFEQLSPTFGNITGEEWSLRRTFVRPDEGSTRRGTEVVQGSKVTISFGEDGFSGTAGCNNYRGLAKVRNGSITVDTGSIYHEEETCEGRELMEQEERYIGLLPKLTQYWVYGDALYVRTDDGVYLLFGTK